MAKKKASKKEAGVVEGVEETTATAEVVDTTVEDQAKADQEAREAAVEAGREAVTAEPQEVETPEVEDSLEGRTTAVEVGQATAEANAKAEAKANS